MASGLNVEDATGLGTASEGIKTLANAIIADPSKVAHAGYYGTKARESLITSAEKTSQMNMMPAFMARTNPAMAPVSGRYAPAPGIAGAAPYIFTPDSQSIAMPGQSSLAATVAPGQPPGPAPGPVGTPVPSPQQAATIMSQSSTPGANTGSPPPVAPPVPGAPPAPNTTTTNGQVPQNDAQGVHPGTFTQPNDGGVKQSGPAGPNGAPAPITPGIASFMAMGAAAGIPADQMKMIGASYVSDWIRTGAMDQNTGARTLAEIFEPSRPFVEQNANQRHAITEGGLNRRADQTEGGLNFRNGRETVTVSDGKGGSKVIYRSELGKEGQGGYDSAATVNQQTIAANTQTATTAYDRAPVWVEEPGKGFTRVARSEKAGRPEVDDKTAEHMMETVQVVENGATKTMSRWEAKAKGLPGYDSAVAVGQQKSAADAAAATVTHGRGEIWVRNNDGSYEQVQRSNQLGRTSVDAKTAQEAMQIVQAVTPQGVKPMERWKAVAQGFNVAPDNAGQVAAQAGAVAGAAGHPVGTAIANATAPKDVSDKDIWDQGQNRNAVNDNYYPASTDLWKRSGLSGVRFRGAAAARLDALVDQIKQTSPQTNDRTAYATAVRQLQSTGELPTDAQLNRPDIFSRFNLGDNSISPADATGKKYLMIDLQDPSGTNAVTDNVEKNPPVPPQPAGRQTIRGRPLFGGGGTTPPPPTSTARPTRPTQPGGGDPVARAPGQPDGAQAQYTRPDGSKGTGIVRGGLVYPQ